MIYKDFTNYVVTYLWKVGDAQLIDNLDNLIRQAEASLNRSVRDEIRHASANLLVVSQRTQLPVDYRSMRQVVDYDGGYGEFNYVDPAALEAARDTYANQWRPIYSLQGDEIMFCGPTEGGRTTTGPVPPSDPQEGDLWARTGSQTGLYIWFIDANSSQWVQLTAEKAVEETASQGRQIVVHYERKIAGYKDNGTSWLEEREPDLFLYAVLMQTAPFLREDERVQFWDAQYQSALTALNEESAHSRQRGVYGAMPLPRQASGYVRKNSRGLNSFKLNSRP